MSKKIEFDMGTMVATSFNKFAKPSKADKKKAKTATATAKQKAAKAKTAVKAKEAKAKVAKKKALPQRPRDEYKDKKAAMSTKPKSKNVRYPENRAMDTQVSVQPLNARAGEPYLPSRDVEPSFNPDELDRIQDIGSNTPQSTDGFSPYTKAGKFLVYNPRPERSGSTYSTDYSEDEDNGLRFQSLRTIPPRYTEGKTLGEKYSGRKGAVDKTELGGIAPPNPAAFTGNYINGKYTFSPTGKGIKKNPRTYLYGKAATSQAVALPPPIDYTKPQLTERLKPRRGYGKSVGVAKSTGGLLTRRHFGTSPRQGVMENPRTYLYNSGDPDSYGEQ